VTIVLAVAAAEATMEDLAISAVTVEDTTITALMTTEDEDATISVTTVGEVDNFNRHPYLRCRRQLRYHPTSHSMHRQLIRGSRPHRPLRQLQTM
jgi:hypothetical protein